MPTEEMPGTSQPGEVAEQLRMEFIDETNEILQSLDVTLDAGRNGHVSHGDIVTAFRRAALVLRGQAANFGFGSLSTLAHRMNEYLEAAPLPLPPRTWDDLQSFLDLMAGPLNGTQTGEGNTPDTDASELVRRLPRKLGFDLGDIQVRNVEVMLVMTPGAQTHFVERELQQCGYRVSVVSDTFLAFAMVTQIKPDLVIVSAMMPGLEGIDLAIGLASMPSTRNIPMAVITSLDPTDDRLKLLPRKVPILQKGPSFGDDLFRALDNLFLI